MKKRLLSRLSYCLAVFAVVLAACSRLNLPEPQAPDSTPPAALVTAARDWFAQVAPATARPVALAWAKAHTYDGWLLVPLADTASPFAAEHKHAYRYLAAQKTAGSAFTGRIVEVVLEGKVPTASNVEQTILAATKRLLATPQAPAPLPGITGLLLFYSPAYCYETGYAYAQGQPLTERVRLLRSPQKTAAPLLTKGASPQGAIDNEGTAECIMELRCGYVNGDLSNCIYVPHCYDSTSGGGDGGGWGGDGGGGGDSAPTTESTVTIVNTTPKVDPKQEVKCFTSSQPATVTIYVNQPVPGTNTLNGGTVGVGHTFVGIEQNGITRYIGYYPRTGASSALLGVGVSYTGEVHDNSGSPYNVSISTTVTGTQLTSIVNYMSNDLPATYNLNSYNCADFGITVGNLAGMNLPVTTTSAFFGRFNGRSPGQLGQDIMNMNPQSGVNVNTTGGNAPTKQGGC